jgi:hypothetical protein
MGKDIYMDFNVLSALRKTTFTLVNKVNSQRFIGRKQLPILKIDPHS